MLYMCAFGVVITYIKGIISVRELKGIYLFYYLIDAAEFSDFNDMH